jgi:D-lactate dehydrogenase
MHTFSQHFPEFIQALQLAIGDANILTDPAECWAYGYDNSRRQGRADVVAFATTQAEVQLIVKLCIQYGIPITARGRGTGTPGGAVPVMGGLVLSFERMNKIVQFDPANRLMVVQPGITNQAVQEAAKKQGFFWPPDPSSASFCTVGGNLAYNAAGPCAIKYGSTRENTLGLKAIIGTGECITTGVYTTKGAVGYDLTRLLIGSEGTLAIITEATLKLTPLSEAKRLLRVVYRTVQDAAIAISTIMAQPIIPCALEFIDHNAINLLREHEVDLPLNAGALLLIEVDGLATTITIAQQKLAEAAVNAGMLDIQLASTAQEAEKLWQARKALSPALRTLAPGKINEDVVVPVSRLPELLYKLDELSKHYGIHIVNFGHAGNGNIHVNLLINNENRLEVQHAAECLSDLFDEVIRLKGTLSGEHGIGIEKRNFISRAIDPVSLSLMRQIKNIFDPSGILNPGKII